MTNDSTARIHRHLRHRQRTRRTQGARDVVLGLLAVRGVGEGGLGDGVDGGGIVSVFVANRDCY